MLDFFNVRISTLLVVILLVLALLTGAFFGVRWAVKSIAAALAGREQNEAVTETAAEVPPNPELADQLVMLTPLAEPPLVTFVDGIAEARSAATDQWRYIDAGDTLEAKSVVRTDSSSLADIRISDGTVVRLMGNTIFSLETLSQEKIKLDLQEGEVISRVKKLAGKQEFSFTSPSAVAGIRGTELALRVSGTETAVYTLSGTVSVVPPGGSVKPVLLSMEQKSIASSSSAPSPSLSMTAAETDRYRRILASLHERQVLLVSSSITFEANSARLTPSSKVEIEGIFDRLNRGDYSIRIIGHTADIGDRAPQIALSSDRAEAVRQYLIELGIPAGRLTAEGVGGARPVAEGNDPESLQKNRRVEFVVE